MLPAVQNTNLGSLHRPSRCTISKNLYPCNCVGKSGMVVRPAPGGRQNGLCRRTEFGSESEPLLWKCCTQVCDPRTETRHARNIVGLDLVHTIESGHTFRKQYISGGECLLTVNTYFFRRVIKGEHYDNKFSFFLLIYHAGVLRFSFGCMSSPAYLSELYEYLYVGGK